MNEPIKTTHGILPFLYGISEDDIRIEIEMYRDKTNDNENPDSFLRPYAINTIIKRIGNERQASKTD